MLARTPFFRIVAQVLVFALVLGMLPAPPAEASIPAPTAAAAASAIERIPSLPELPSLAESVPPVLLAVVAAVVGDEEAAPCVVVFAVADPHKPSKYHRARWMDPRVGRFLGMDPFGGNEFDPPSLHRYLYAGADPANKIDPTGLEFTIASLTTVSGVLNTINAISLGVTVFTTAFQATTIAHRLSTDDQYELEDALEDARKAGTTAALHALLNFAAPLAAGRIISQLGTLGVIRLGNVARANGLLAEHLVANANGLWVALRKVPLPTGGIPDFVTKTALHEVKNGARLLWSNRKLRDQLIEYATYCAQTGKEMVLHVRPGARVGSNLISNLNQILQRAGGKPLQVIRDIPDHLRVIP